MYKRQLAAVLAVAVMVAACNGQAATRDEPTAVTEGGDSVSTASTDRPAAPVGPKDQLLNRNTTVPFLFEPPSEDVDENTFMLDCMNQAGFPGEIDPDGGLLFDTPPDQQDFYFQAISFCSNAYREAAGMEIGPPSVSTLETWYRAYKLLQICLETNGYPVAEPPSLSVFVESGGEWHPYDEIMTTDRLRDDEDYTPEGLVTLEETCPQDPEHWTPRAEQ